MCIVSSSYGRVEDFEVITSIILMLVPFSGSLTSNQRAHRRNHALRSPKARHKHRVEDDDHQRRLDRVTSDSYLDNISAYDTNPELGDGRPTNKGPPGDALHTTLAESTGNSKGDRCNARTWAGDLTPNSSDIMKLALYVSSHNRHRASWQA